MVSYDAHMWITFDTYIADTPSHSTFFVGSSTLVGLTFDTFNSLEDNLIKGTQQHTEIHNMVSTNGAVVDYNIPSPECYCVPLVFVSVKEHLTFECDFTFLTSNLFLLSSDASAPLAFDVFPAIFAFAGAVAPASCISTSAMIVSVRSDSRSLRVFRVGFSKEIGRS